MTKQNKTKLLYFCPAALCTHSRLSTTVVSCERAKLLYKSCRNFKIPLNIHILPLIGMLGLLLAIQQTDGCMNDGSSSLLQIGGLVLGSAAVYDGKFGIR